jgi:O-antigen/teichoic acid export membrane protein
MSVKQKGISGVKWTSFSTIVLAVVAIVKVSILTRILNIGDFGLIALVTFILGVISIFIDLGLPSAILHKQEISKNEYSSLFFLNIFFSGLMFLVLVVLTPVFSTFYDEVELLNLVPITAIGLIINALGSQQRIVEQKELNFRLLAIVEICSSVISLGVATIMALDGYGVYALVYSNLIFITITSLFYFSRGLFFKRLIFHFRLSDVKSFLKIGVFNIGGQVINYFTKEMDVLIIGKFFGKDILGGYSLAKQLLSRPLAVIRPVVMKVASPILAKIQNNKDELASNYLTIVNIVSAISFPVFIGFALFADFIVFILYGDNYGEIVPFVRILSIYTFFVSVRIPLGTLIIATGKTHLEFYWFLVTSILTFGAIIFGVSYGPAGAAWALSLSMVLFYIPMWRYIIQKLISVSLVKYVKAHIPNYLTLYNLMTSSKK